MIAATHTTWVTVVGALVPSLIALIAAIVGVLNRKALATGTTKSVGQLATEVSGQLQTGNEKTVGEMVTEVHGEASTQATPYDTHGEPPAPVAS